MILICYSTVQMANRTSSFRYEEELRSSFVEKAFISCRIKDRDLETIHFQESNCSEGRADLVTAKICRTWMNVTKPAQASLYRQPTCSKILSALKPQAARTESLLVCSIGVSTNTLRYWLNKLVEAELIYERGNRKYVLSPQFYIPKAEILSYEFKLSNWKRALFQATRYRIFSHQVFVVMPPESLAPAIKNLEVFKRFNIGIMSHDASGQTKTIFQPKKRMPFSKVHFLMALGMLQDTEPSAKRETGFKSLDRIHPCA